MKKWHSQNDVAPMPSSSGSAERQHLIEHCSVPLQEKAENDSKTSEPVFLKLVRRLPDLLLVMEKMYCVSGVTNTADKYGIDKLTLEGMVNDAVLLMILRSNKRSN